MAKIFSWDQFLTSMIVEKVTPSNRNRSGIFIIILTYKRLWEVLMYSHIDCWKQAQKTVDHVGVSKNRGGPPKWMVFFHGKPYEQMDDFLGG